MFSSGDRFKYKQTLLGGNQYFHDRDRARGRHFLGDLGAVQPHLIPEADGLSHRKLEAAYRALLWALARLVCFRPIEMVSGAYDQAGLVVARTPVAIFQVSPLPSTGKSRGVTQPKYFTWPFHFSRSSKDLDGMVYVEKRKQQFIFFYFFFWGVESEEMVC